MSHYNHKNCKSCDPCIPCAPDTGACCLRKTNYYVEACPTNHRHHKSKNPTKGKDPVYLFVQDYGPLDAQVILIPDGLLAPDQFEYQFGPLLDAGFRVVAVTPRGMGSSDKPECLYSLDVWADDLNSVIEQLRLCDFILVGSTPLSRISTRYMTRHGCDKVKGAFFHSPNAFSMVFQAIGPALKTAMATDRENTVDDLVSLFFSPVVITDATRNWANNRLLQLPIRVWQGLIDSLLEDLRPELKCVCTCVLGIVGEFDQFNSIPEAEAFIAGIPDGKLIVVPGAGHSVQISIPGQTVYNDNLIAFAKACDPCAYLQNFVPPPLPDPVPGFAPFSAAPGFRRLARWNANGPADAQGEPLF